MDPTIQKRIDTAWEDSQSWVAEFDGTPHLALLLNTDPERLVPAFGKLAAQTENFRVTSIPAESTSTAQFIPLDALPQQLELQQAGKLEELSVNFAARQPAFDLDVRLIIHLLEGNQQALELIWWSDQVFSEETDQRAQFQELASYFLGMQQLFAAQNLFISPESGRLATGEGVDNWVEI